MSPSWVGLESERAREAAGALANGCSWSMTKRVRFMARRALERAGYQPTVVDGAETALRRIEANEEPFDVVVTDLSMPGMSGFDVATRLRESHPDLPIILMTGLMDDESSRRAATLGLEGVVNKPFGVHDLTAAIADALRHSRLSNKPD